jgi:CBS domain containing-hemolysin-like protein
MRDVLVRELMIPIADYVAVGRETSLVDVMRALEAARTSGTEHAHRDVIVVGAEGEFVGKVTMIDVFRALEPNYKKVGSSESTDILSSAYIINAVRDFGLWLEPMASVCDRGMHVTAGEIMHTPEPQEFLREDDTLEKALHLFVMGVNQPLIVKSGETVTGVLRFGDLFEVVRKRLLACEV